MGHTIAHLYICTRNTQSSVLIVWHRVNYETGNTAFSMEPLHTRVEAILGDIVQMADTPQPHATCTFGNLDTILLGH